MILFNLNRCLFDGKILNGGYVKMPQDCIIKNERITKDDVKKMLEGSLHIENGPMVYIIPERTGEKCLLNEFAPDLCKIAKGNNISCTMVYDHDNYEYLSLRDSEILLPFLISLAAGACYDLLKLFITRFFPERKNLKVRLITKKRAETEFQRIEIKGDAENVLHALEILKEDDENPNLHTSEFEENDAVVS